MWLTCSSIGRKFVMALTGTCLVLFLTFHVAMNAVALWSPAAYNAICGFLGANWYALVASMGLALLFVVHIIYALWLTVQNRRARGNDRYRVTAHQPGVEWSSKNMLVLGIVVVAFLVVHMIQFWAKMQLTELLSHNPADWTQVEGAPAAPEFGSLYLQLAFQQIWTPIVYIIGFVALWLHMNHGIWSMMQTYGWNNDTWMKRLKCISLWWTSIVVGLFVIQAVVFTVLARQNYFTENEALQEQYAEYWGERAEALNESFTAEFAHALKQAPEGADRNQVLAAFFADPKCVEFINAAKVITEAAEKQCPKLTVPAVESLAQSAADVEQSIEYAKSMTPNQNN
ncbi:MAG: succinate dehydrogenase cytochrome b subunit [Muribaculaceae bacterium]|nr:succinate dehydrogenase cytochrome b subunit [Muribaculaceae bacterium]